MSSLFAWLALSAFTGNPILSGLVVLVVLWAMERLTLGVLPSPLRALRRWMRIQALRRALELNPHDRRARLELGELLLVRRRFRAVVEVLRPNVEAGDEDVSTLFVMGAGCLGAGHLEQGEALLGHAEEQDPDYRVGEIDLWRGRAHLGRGAYAEARAVLERFCRVRQGTVEGRVLLARALDGLKETAQADQVRAEAWREYKAAPRFRRRQERLWAWRAQPQRPLGVAAAVAGGLALLWLAGG